MNAGRIGKLRERIAIERPVRTPDGAGGHAASWTEHASLWAEVISLKGTELMLGERGEAREIYRIVVRYRADVTNGMRIRWRGRVLAIRAALDPDGERRWLAMDAEGSME